VTWVRPLRHPLWRQWADPPRGGYLPVGAVVPYHVHAAQGTLVAPHW
jgi:hypothetical protein